MSENGEKKSVDERGSLLGQTKIAFSFQQVPPGTYALVTFLDMNGNGMLDSGFFGPTEPWGMSFRTSRPRFRAPRFEDASFTLPEENRFFRIELN
jgi:uncharacterized protein (DUF2141 family)